MNLRDYDAGLLNDYGGGNVGWWQDYIRAEIGRCNDYWREQVEQILALFSVEIQEECPYFDHGRCEQDASGFDCPFCDETCHGTGTVPRTILITQERVRGMVEALRECLDFLRHIQSSRKGSIGSLENVYCSNSDRTGVDTLAKKIDNALAGLKGER
jgi:hypothetical protein